MGRGNGWSRELGSLEMKIEILTPPFELLGSMEGTTLIFSPFSWLILHGTGLCSLTLTRALKGEMLPGKSYKSLCTFDRITFTAHQVPAALLHTCSDPSVRKITQLHSRALCKSLPPRRYSCGPWAHLTDRWSWGVHEEIFSEEKMAVFPYGDVGSSGAPKKG